MKSLKQENLNVENQHEKKNNKKYFIVKAIFYGFATLCSMFFLFNSIAVVIGIIFFFFFKDKWKIHGLILTLATSLSNIAPQQELIGLKGIYPFALVVAVNWGILGFYFIFLILKHLSYITKFTEFIQKRFTYTLFHSKKKKRITLQIFMYFLVLSSSVIWLWSNVNFQVMLNNNPSLLWVHVPSTTRPNEPFTVTVQSWDKFQRNSAVYDGTISFDLISYNYSTLTIINEVDKVLPSSYTFTASSLPSDVAHRRNNQKDNGMQVFEAVIVTPGIHYILVSDSFTGEAFYSNPILVRDDYYDIYWGDVHTHSIYSDGSGTPEQNFFFARYVAKLDFYALTEHGEIISLLQLMDSYIKKTQKVNIPGEFVTFLGMEYTNHNTGHFVCIFNGDELMTDPVISYRSLDTPFDLWDALDGFTAETGSKVLAIPHHTIKERYMQDWTYYNPKYVKIAEVTSVHGDNLFEYHHPLNYRGSTAPPPYPINGSSIIDALRMGLHLSLNGGSDGHDGHPGRSISHTDAYITHQRPYTFWWTRIDKPYPGGITAVISPSLSRSTIFDQLENRFVYANSDHGRPLLNFTISGQPVGGNSTIYVPTAETAREIEIFLAQDGAPARKVFTAASITNNWVPNWNANIEIIKNGEIFKTFSVNEPVVRLSFTDSTPIAGAIYGKESCVLKDGKYYINEYSDNPVDPDTLNTGGIDFYIIRVVGQNGRHSYIGPIFVSV